MWRNRLLIGLVVLISLPFAARAYVHLAVRERIYSDVSQTPHCRVALVLGANVNRDGSLCPSLASRVDKAIELYRAGKCEKLLMSGDNRFKNYNEPERMRDYAVRHGVSLSHVALDYAGRRTYDSVYRARHIFGIKRMLIVTQAFHVDRAVFLSKHNGIDAFGVGSNNRADTRAQIRECPACLSAIADVYLLHPHPVMGKKEAI
jgi:SanA protein